MSTLHILVANERYLSEKEKNCFYTWTSPPFSDFSPLIQKAMIANNTFLESVLSRTIAYLISYFQPKTRFFDSTTGFLAKIADFSEFPERFSLDRPNIS